MGSPRADRGRHVVDAIPGWGEGAVNRTMRTRVPTVALLVCGALASVHVLLHLGTVGVLTFLAPVSPPLYGLVAGLHAVMPFLARRLTRLPGSATVTAVLAGVIVALSSSSGLLVLVPLVLTGVVIDAVVWTSDRENVPGWRAETRYFLAGALSGSVLFLVSLAVFSAEHLTLVLEIATLVTRILGEVGAAAISGLLARALRRAGVGRSVVSRERNER